MERVSETERRFELHLQSGTIVGRADVVLRGEGGQCGAMALGDYKTNKADSDDRLHRLQLQVYTSAARREGVDVQAAYLFDLDRAKTQAIAVEPADLNGAEGWVSDTLSDMLAEDFSARPGTTCRHCDVGLICRDCRT